MPLLPCTALCRQAALGALQAWPGGLQLGGGVNTDNAKQWLDAGGSHVIVTSFVFREGRLEEDRLQALVSETTPCAHKASSCSLLGPALMPQSCTHNTDPQVTTASRNCPRCSVGTTPAASDGDSSLQPVCNTREPSNLLCFLLLSATMLSHLVPRR